MTRNNPALKWFPAAFVLVFLTLFACNSQKSEKPPGSAPESPQQVQESPVAQLQTHPSAAPTSPFPEMAIPFHFYGKYVGVLGESDTLSFDLTFANKGYGTQAVGRLVRHSRGTTSILHGNIADTGFSFKAPDASGGSEVFNGKTFSQDFFEGHWTQVRMDSTSDATNSPDKVTRLFKSLPFRMSRAKTGFIPLHFERFSRSNDSLAKLHKAENRIEAPWDTLPSELTVSLITVDHPDSAVGATANQSIVRTLLDFYVASEELNTSDPMKELSGVLKDFDRHWKAHAPNHDQFAVAYTSEVVANENGFLSIQFQRAGHIGGSPHPSFQFHYATFDMKTGLAVSLGEQYTVDNAYRVGFLAGPPFCPDGFESEADCATEELLKHGFALLHDGILFHPEIAGQTVDMHVPYQRIGENLESSSIIAPLIRR